MPLLFTTAYLEDASSVFRKYKKLAEDAMLPVSDEHFFVAPGGSGGDSNSLAVIVKHVAGNLRSRWTDFLSTDGEKPWRDRDAEFAGAPQSRESLMAEWQAGWDCLFSTLATLRNDDLSRRVAIRGEAHSVLQAINRQLAHYSYHVGQIVWLSKYFRGAGWTPLTIPKPK